LSAENGFEAQLGIKSVNTIKQFKHYASLSLAAIVLTGCATGPTAHPEDPLEPLNREIYSFNRGVDAIVIEPAAGIYHKFIPPQVRAAVTNFFSNVNDVNVVANQVLQGKIPDAMHSATRLALNTTIGVGGLFDVASSTGLYKMRADFGTTLAFYGVKKSPYLVLPFLGPSTIRDSAGLVVDFYLSPYGYVEEWVFWYAVGLNYLNQRSNLLEELVFVDYAAMDSYAFVRDIYLQRRNALINGTQETNEWENGKWDDWEKPWSSEVAPAVEISVQPKN
jgi:phospholipid-binding lipoprotein MlaA